MTAGLCLCLEGGSEKGSTTTFGVPPVDADGGAGQAAQEPMALAALQTSVPAL